MSELFGFLFVDPVNLSPQAVTGLYTWPKVQRNINQKPPWLTV